MYLPGNMRLPAGFQHSAKCSATHQWNLFAGSNFLMLWHQGQRQNQLESENEWLADFREG
jgi:hypothetical protein